MPKEAPSLLKPPPKTQLPRLPTRSPGKAADVFQAVIEALVGASGLPNNLPASRASAAGEMLGMAAPLGAVVAGLGKVAKMRTPIKAYHGSPHDFDKFDLSKIGTGEGAQAYGHGLYFAENEATAKAYRDQWPSSQRGPRIKVDGQNLYELAAGAKSPLEMRAYKRLIEDGDVDMAIRNAAPHSAYPDQDVQRLLMEWKRTRRIETPSGRMYEVNIHADPESLLDWDKPLSQQSDPVRATLRERFGLYGPRQSATGASYDPPGSVAYDALQVPRTSHGNSVAASSALRESGVPGIKYLDQGSRGTNADQWLVTSPTGLVRAVATEAEAKAIAARVGGRITEPNVTHNYVIFDDSIIDILRKWGLLPAVAVGGGALMNQEAR